VIDTLIHTAEGKLEIDDPFLRVGTRGYLLSVMGGRSRQFIITEKCVESSIRRRDRRKEHGRVDVEPRYYVHTLSQHKPPRLLVNGAVLRLAKRLEVLDPSDPDYPKVKGY